jgi:iron(III) transport system permease protein
MIPQHWSTFRFTFTLLSAAVASVVIVPIIYLVLKATQAQPDKIIDLVWNVRNMYLFLNTVFLAGGVLFLTTLIAFPLAWVITRTDLKFKAAFTLMSVLPLAIPGYMLAYTLMGLTGANGSLALSLGIEVPRMGGYWGALLAISLYTFPYMFLNLKAGLSGLDPSLEEAAQTFGYSKLQVIGKVVIPQLKPSFWAGTLIIGLYVLGDFGAVSLMRFETFSYALFLQYSASYDRIYAAWLALLMLSVTGVILVAEYKLLKGLRLHRTSTGAARSIKSEPLGVYAPFVYVGLLVLHFISVIVPVSTILFWWFRLQDMGVALGWTNALFASLSASIPSALVASILAVPVAYMMVRKSNRAVRIFERLVWLGYSIPPLALSLAFIFFSLSAAPWLYHTLALLIIAYSIHFMAEALGPIRTALYQSSPRLEEAARSLGASHWRSFFTITIPLLRNSMVAGAAFVFLSSMKELPMAYILAPIGFETLSVNVWSYTNEAMFAHAAPYALTILVVSGIFVSILFSKEWRSL